LENGNEAVSSVFRPNTKFEKLSKEEEKKW